MPNARLVPFNTRLYRNQKAALRDRCRREGIGCVLCGEAFDFTLRYPDPGSFEVHHDPPLATGADPCDPGGQWPAHRLCNEQQGTKPMQAPQVPMRQSEDWP